MPPVTAAFSPALPEHYFGLAKQASKGTGVAPAFFAAYTEALALDHNHAIRAVREGGAGFLIARHLRDAALPTFRFAAPLRADLFGIVATLFLGKDTISGASDPFTHTITNDVPTLWATVERNIKDEEIERLVDAFITELTIDIRKRDSGPEMLMVASGGALSAERQPTPTAESYETNRAFLRSDIAWLIDGNVPTNVEACTVSMRWQYDESILADAVTRFDAAKIAFEVDVEIVQVFNSAQEAIDYRETHYFSGAADGTGTVYAETVYGSGASAFAMVPTFTDREASITIPALDWSEAKLTEPDPEASEAVRLTRTGHLIAPSAGEAITLVADSATATAYDA